MKHIVATLLVMMLFGVLAVHASSSQKPLDKQLQQLQKERDKLKRSRDPVDHTKTQIAISEILLTFVGESVKNGDFNEMQKQLGEYCEAIQDAHKTIMSTGRDANRHPGGFKDLEIALRRQILRLGNFAQALNYDQREPLTKAKEDASGIRDNLIKALLVEDKNAKPAAP